MINAILAAAAAVASLASKAQRDAADARRENALKALHKQQTVQGILQNRAQAGGANTLQSQIAGSDQEFLRQLAAGRRDSSGDILPFVNSLSGVAQGIASDAAKTPKAPSVPASQVNFQGYSGTDAGGTGGLIPSDDEDERNKFLRGLASRGGMQA